MHVAALPLVEEEVDPARELVARFKDGDPLAFKEIVALYRSNTFGIVFRLLRNRQDAEEVTQDAFIRAHRNIASFRSECSFPVWLNAIAANLARDRYRYWWRRKRDQWVSFDQPLHADSDATLDNLIAAKVDDPGDAAEAAEFDQRVADGIRRLRKDHRQVLLLRYAKNMAYEDIAGELGLNLNTVKSRIRRAREALRLRLPTELKNEESKRG